MLTELVDKNNLAISKHVHIYVKMSNHRYMCHNYVAPEPSRSGYNRFGLIMQQYPELQLFLSKHHHVACLLFAISPNPLYLFLFIHSLLKGRRAAGVQDEGLSQQAPQTSH